MTWIWIEISTAQAVHDRQLAEHGGADGIRDQGALESALARPRNLASYEKPDAAALAAAYAFGVTRNHPYVDGNKRTTWVLARLFLAANGIGIKFDKQDAIQTMLVLAAGELSEEELVIWFRERVV